MKETLFSQRSPLFYRISVLKCQVMRRISDRCGGEHYAKVMGATLPVVVCQHNSLIRPGGTFSFWRLVGNPTVGRGYCDGLTIANGATCRGVGGGMCQFTNLIHWLVLHTPLEITEHHHHDGYDLFPDFNRQIPFGTGTSIVYNYLDYRVKNTTGTVFQLVVYTTQEHLRGEIRADRPLPYRYHIKAKNEGFVRADGAVFRVGEIWRSCVDIHTGNTISEELIRTNRAKVMYDTANLPIREI